MISVDTNILVRFLTHDDERQYKKAYDLFKKNEIFIPDTVILETEWVLRYAYDFESSTICKAFTSLFGLKNVHLAHPPCIAQVIDWVGKGLDFADAFHLSNSQHCLKLATFDAGFIKKGKGLSYCSVERL